MKKHYFGYLSLIALLVFSSCEKDENDKPGGIYSNGAFIVNEGNYGRSNASVSFYNFSTDSVIQDIFMKENSRELGDVLQSMTIYDGKAYMVLNNSHKIEIANVTDFKQSGVIENLSNPRYIAFYDNKAYVTQWTNLPTSTGNVAIVCLNNNSIETTITTGIGPEGIIIVSGKIWVANGGGWSIDSTISVIDPNSKSVTQTITVGINPKHFVKDKDGNIWVLCSGYADWVDSNNDLPSSLVKINPTTFSVIAKIEIGKNAHPLCVAINKEKNIIYYGAGYGLIGIWKISVNDPMIANQPFIDGYFYGFSVNPKNNEIYTFDAKDYKSAGVMTRYNANGVIIKSYNVGIIPNGVVFQ